MKLFITVLLSLLLFAQPSNGKEPDGYQPNLYFSAAGGFLLVEDPDASTGLGLEADTAAVVSGSIGVYLAEQTRVEIEWVHQHGELDGLAPADDLRINGVPVFPGAPVNGRFDINSVLLSFYFDFPLDNTPTPVSLYVGFGGGASLVNADIFVSGRQVGGDDVVPTYHLTFGVSNQINKRHILFGHCRIQDGGDWEFGDLTVDPGVSVTLMAGWRMVW